MRCGDSDPITGLLWTQQSSERQRSTAARMHHDAPWLLLEHYHVCTSMSDISS